MAIIYTPGNEPEKIRRRLDTLFVKLDAAYPDKVIFGLNRDHKKWGETVTELYRLLGYESNTAFLNAYGYTVRAAEPKGAVGRQKTTDEKALIQDLQERHPNGASFKSIDELCEANPDFAAKRKTLANNAIKYFGMTLVKYLKSLGLIISTSRELPVAKVKKTIVYHYFSAVVEGRGETVLCAIKLPIIHKDDFVEMIKVGEEEKIIGRVEETHYYLFKEEMPMPHEEMYQYSRKMSKSEMKDIEATKIKYIFCSVQIDGRMDSLYYLSPFEGIQVDDIVEVPHNWYGSVRGIITKVEHVSEKTAPFSVKKTKKILRIVSSVKEEAQKAKKLENNIGLKYGVKDFVKAPENASLTEQYKKTTYFSGAVFRGLEWEINEALKMVYPSTFHPIKYADSLRGDVYQFTCNSSLVPKIIERHANLKAIFFAENWKEGNVYLAYSESGYSTVTSFRLIGKCNFYTRDRWSLIHDPSENSFKYGDLEYIFEEKEAWEKIDYVLSNGERSLNSVDTIPSKPYPKTKTTDPCAIIEIRYPESEIFYEAPQKSTTKVVTDKVIQSNMLSGKIFVVTGDLFNYSSREELKEVIEQNGGKLEGSVSSKTTALITNYPDSGTTKIRKAKEIGIEIITEDDFVQRFMPGSNNK